VSKKKRDADFLPLSVFNILCGRRGTPQFYPVNGKLPIGAARLRTVKRTSVCEGGTDARLMVVLLRLYRKRGDGLSI